MTSTCCGRWRTPAAATPTVFLEHGDQAPAVFESEIEGLLDLAGQNATIEVRPEASVRLAAVHHRYPREEVDGGLRLELGDLYAREPKAVLAEFLMEPAGDEGRTDASGGADAAGETASGGDGAVDERDPTGGGVDAFDVAMLLVTAHAVTADGGVERRERRSTPQG